MSWQRTHAANIARRKSSNASTVPQKVSANDMLAASYYNGIGYEAVISVLNMTGFDTQSRDTFFRHMPQAGLNIEQKADELMEEARKNFSGHIAIDCRWSSPVRAVHGTVTLVDNVNNTVIENTTLTKVGRNRPRGNFTGTSNNMETEGSHPVIKKKKHHNIFDQVKTISKDRDNKSSKLLKDLGSQNLIRFDPCHFRKNIRASFKTLFPKIKSSFTTIKMEMK